MASYSILPSVPVKHADFIPYIKANDKTPLSELLEPYKQYDAKLREVFAQEIDHPDLSDPHLNVVPLYNGHQKSVNIRARDVDNETPEEKKRYIMPLSKEERLLSGAPAIVQDLDEFKRNFTLFSESSLTELDWSNVVAAGSSVVTSLLPVPEKYKKSKRDLRTYYHEKIAPASDVDLFLYGLSEEEAIQKIIQIETCIKNSILAETTTIRTKNAITIASQYPTRHVQIVLRIYKSVSEILTGFDVDSSCVAYDGKTVYASPRAIVAYMTQCNTIDLTRRSPSYENRLSKYSHRGFEVYWPLLDRSRVDPTIFERSFSRTVGLARLLVLERLPTSSDREQYMDQRRRERGRPPINRHHHWHKQGNIKEAHEDEVAEWVVQEDVSDYHTFTIPYGVKYDAKKIEKLLYTKDLLLNAEWNKPEDREVNLHRHPAFFGYAEDVIQDCCGSCPEPVTPEEHDVAEEESKIYVSGKISFIKDDPGRQAIGSFNPITDDDWTEMAYVGNTARLCQAIVDGDLEHVEDWLSHEGSDPNCRDYTGRTPLHLATSCSTPEIVQSLINHGARLIARLADGRTALHIAAARGNFEMVKMILQKSEANEEEEAQKEDARKQAKMEARKATSESQRDGSGILHGDEDEGQSSDIEMVECGDEDEDVEMKSTTTGSYVNVERDVSAQENALTEDEDEPDVYDVNVLSWDTKCSPLHLAILNGHIDVIRDLVQTFGADVLLPIKLLNSYDNSPQGAIMTLVLALRLPLEKAKAMTKALLELGASSAQADMNQVTALHYISGEAPELLDTLVEVDEPAVKRAVNHLATTGNRWNPEATSPLISAIASRDSLAALKLLGIGANPSIDFKDWIKSAEAKAGDYITNKSSEENRNTFLKTAEQPIILAVEAELPNIVLELLAQGADPNTLTKDSHQVLVDSWRADHWTCRTLLDSVRNKITHLKNYDHNHGAPTKLDPQVKKDVDYLEGMDPSSYKYFVTKCRLQLALQEDIAADKSYRDQLEAFEKRKGLQEKANAVAALLAEFEAVEAELLKRGAKTFRELYPDKGTQEPKPPNHGYYGRYRPVQVKLEVQFGFEVFDLSDETRAGYINLFQAAWDGDLDTIKSLTLSSWGPEGNQKALKIAVKDSTGHSPFSLAVLRGHYDVARAMVEIAFAQYEHSVKTVKQRYAIGHQDSDDESYDERSMDGASDASDFGIPVYKQIIDDKFTLEDIGHVATTVKSSASPLSLVENGFMIERYQWFTQTSKENADGTSSKDIGSGISTLVRWAILENNRALFTFILDLMLEWADKLHSVNEEISPIPWFSNDEYELALRLGRLGMLAEMIKHTGVGMDLQALVKASGVKFVEKPKYYQGLSVHGKKRADWAAAAQGIHGRHDDLVESSAPLLKAAHEGSLESVEWFLSDAPIRHYQDFGEANKANERIRHLNTFAGGFDKVLSKWYGARRDLVIHCALLSSPRRGENFTRLLKYLIGAVPESLETKSEQGYTPLALAFALHDVEAARILIEAGANQTVRTITKDNILHLMLDSHYCRRRHDEEVFQNLFSLIDPRLISSLLSERAYRSATSYTPLALTLHACKRIESIRAVLKLGEASNNEQLEMFDSSGNTPIHKAVQMNWTEALRLFLDCRPELLYYENATGRTPAEMAEDAYIASCVREAPKIGNAMYYYRQSITDKQPDEFVGEKKTAMSNEEQTWRLCQEYQGKVSRKRKLVSLLDANDVAKRLANHYGGKRQRPVFNGDEGNEEGSDVDGGAGEAGDEVLRWSGWSECVAPDMKN